MVLASCLRSFLACTVLSVLLVINPLAMHESLLLPTIQQLFLLEFRFQHLQSIKHSLFSHLNLPASISSMLPYLAFQLRFIHFRSLRPLTLQLFLLIRGGQREIVDYISDVSYEA